MADLDGSMLNGYEVLKGFFCTVYQVQTPPSGWGLQQGLCASPSTCQSVKQTFFLSDTINNAFTFFQAPNQKTTITPIAADEMNINIVPAKYDLLPGTDAFGWGAINMNGALSFNHSGYYAMYTKVFVAVRDSSNAVALDQFNQPLSRFMFLPFLSPDIKNNIVLHVLDALQIGAVNHTGNTCFFPFVEGKAVTLFVKNLPFKNAPITYSWTAPGLKTGKTNGDYLTLTELPDGGTQFTISVKVINQNTGCIATGSTSYTTYTEEVSGTMSKLCTYRYLIYTFVHPWLINPLGPDDPAFIKYSTDNFRKFIQIVS